MKTSQQENRFGFSISQALLAGLAGGIAEVLWIMAWTTVTPLQATTVAREVTRTVFPGMFEAALATETGLVIHLAISLVLGVVFVWTLGKYLAHHYRGTGVLAGSIISLTLIWAVNFLLVLPALNPVFVTLMPAGVTLVSKILFGLTMGLVLVAVPRRYETLNRMTITS